MFSQEKLFKKQQWNEHRFTGGPKPMTAHEIEELRQNLIASYKCDSKDITYTFAKVSDEADEARNTCVWLIYRMNCVIAGEPKVKDIFSIKVPVPEELKRRAEDIKKKSPPRSILPSQ